MLSNTVFGSRIGPVSWQKVGVGEGEMPRIPNGGQIPNRTQVNCALLVFTCTTGHTAGEIRQQLHPGDDPLLPRQGVDGPGVRHLSVPGAVRGAGPAHDLLLLAGHLRALEVDQDYEADDWSPVCSRAQMGMCFEVGSRPEIC